MAEEYDYLFKSIVVGDGGVGKTALTLRFSKGFFTEDYKMTIGVDFHVKTISIDSNEGPIRAKLQIWDTGGQERFSSIRPMYYRGSLGALFFLHAVSKQKASIVVTATALYPLITIILACLILKEPITLKQGIGIIFALIAMILLTL